MRSIKRLTYAATIMTAAIAAVFVLCTGCDSEPSQDFGITVSPQQVKVTGKGKAEFVASGAVRYTWTLSHNNPDNENDIWGVLSSTTGERVTYTIVRTPKNATNHIQTITVTGTVGDDDNNLSTNASSQTSFAHAYVTHKW